jgi:hypothetical protein
MKKMIAVFMAISLIGLLPVTGCRPSATEEHTLIPAKDMGILPSGQEAPDDIMPAPGMGPAYRANIHQQGVENPWPSIEISETSLGSGADEAHIYYRSHIETSAGETRNNVIKVIIPGKDIKSLSLYADNVPQSITLTDGMQWSGPNSRASVLVIGIAPDVAPGEYPLEIGLIVNGKDFGTLPCTINVITEEVQPQDNSILEHARLYRVISEGNIDNQDLNRSVGLWFVTSEEASGFEEYAQTAVQAVLDLYRLHGRDFTSVLVIPNDKLEYAGVSYAQANFSADGKGAAGMTGDAPAKEGYWVVRAADRELTEQELAITELWKTKQQDFPQTNPVSSLSYDPEALRQYIADTLNIPYDEAQMPHLEMHEYELDQSFLDSFPSGSTSTPPETTSALTEYFKEFQEPLHLTRLAAEDEKKLTEIVLSDARVQELIKDKSYDFEVGGIRVQGSDWHLATGVLLKEGLTSEQRRDFMQQSLQGQINRDTVESFRGQLSIGSGGGGVIFPFFLDIYDIVIDYDGSRVESVSQFSKAQVPQLTLSERKQAVETALNDVRLQEILKDKIYRFAPTGVYVVPDKDFNKVGAAFEIWLDKTYSIDVTETGQLSEGSVLAVCVTFADNKVSLRLQGGPS